MIAERLGFAALFLPAAYVAVRLLVVLPTTAVGIPAAFAVGLAVALLTSRSGRVARWGSVGLGALLVAAVIATLVEPSTSAGVGSDLAVGALLAVPFVASAVAGREGETLFFRFVAFALGLTLGIVILATYATVAAASESYTATTVLGAFGAVNVRELGGIANLVSGTGATDLPLHDLFDTTYAALGAIALLGLLLLFVRPQTGRAEPLPVAFRVGRSDEATRELTDDYGFSEVQRDVFRHRSEALPPATTGPPGFDAVVLAAVAVGVFVGLGVALPYDALLVATAALAAGAGALIAMAGRSPAPRRPRRWMFR